MEELRATSDLTESSTRSPLELKTLARVLQIQSPLFYITKLKHVAKILSVMSHDLFLSNVTRKAIRQT